jgi:large subunit ribosomal protein L29
MKIAQLREKSKEELRQMVEDHRRMLRQLRFDLAAGKVKNVKEIRELRKTIAQILTLCQKDNS